MKLPYILGFVGFVLGHIPGAAIGYWIGLKLESWLAPSRRAAPTELGFIDPLFALLGSVAKSDGRVSEAEIAVAERLLASLDLSPMQRQQAVRSFNRGKQPDFDVTGVINELRGWISRHRNLAMPVFDVVIETVLAEGDPSPEKMSVLRQLAFALRVSDAELMTLMALKGYAWNPGSGGQRHRGGGGHQAPPTRYHGQRDPYAVLGIARGADAHTVKRAYRKLISRHHPDRLGDLSKEMRQRAETRASEINAAYEHIKSELGFK